MAHANPEFGAAIHDRRQGLDVSDGPRPPHCYMPIGTPQWQVPTTVRPFRDVVSATTERYKPRRGPTCVRRVLTLECGHVVHKPLHNESTIAQCGECPPVPWTRTMTVLDVYRDREAAIRASTTPAIVRVKARTDTHNATTMRWVPGVGHVRHGRAHIRAIEPYAPRAEKGVA